MDTSAPLERNLASTFPHYHVGDASSAILHQGQSKTAQQKEIQDVLDAQKGKSSEGL